MTQSPITLIIITHHVLFENSIAKKKKEHNIKYMT